MWEGRISRIWTGTSRGWGRCPWATGRRGRRRLAPRGRSTGWGSRAPATGRARGRGDWAGGRYGGVAAGGARAVAVGHTTRYVSPTALRAQAAVVRGGYYTGYFSAGWYRAHAGAWVPARWRVPNVWVAPAWP